MAENKKDLKPGDPGTVTTITQQYARCAFIQVEEQSAYQARIEALTRDLKAAEEQWKTSHKLRRGAEGSGKKEDDPILKSLRNSERDLSEHFKDLLEQNARAHPIMTWGDLYDVINRAGYGDDEYARLSSDGHKPDYHMIPYEDVRKIPLWDETEDPARTRNQDRIICYWAPGDSEGYYVDVWRVYSKRDPKTKTTEDDEIIDRDLRITVKLWDPARACDCASFISRLLVTRL